MKEHPRLGRRPAVERITDDRMPGMRQVDADLMQSPGDRLDVEVSCRGGTRQDSNTCKRLRAGMTDGDSLGLPRQETQWSVEAPPRRIERILRSDTSGLHAPIDARDVVPANAT